MWYHHRMIIVGTGHRPDKLGGYDSETFQGLIDLAETALERYNPELVISGMALGWDQALALASINLGIPVISALPFKGQENKWPEPSRLRYNCILQMAKEKFILSPSYDKGCLQRRNIWMVDQLEDPEDFILALWDGSDGGTKNCLEYAKQKNKKIINLWEAFQELK